MGADWYEVSVIGYVGARIASKLTFEQYIKLVKLFEAMRPEVACCIKAGEGVGREKSGDKHYVMLHEGSESLGGGSMMGPYEIERDQYWTQVTISKFRPPNFDKLATKLKDICKTACVCIKEPKCYVEVTNGGGNDNDYEDEDEDEDGKGDEDDMDEAEDDDDEKDEDEDGKGDEDDMDEAEEPQEEEEEEEK